ncbi:Na/Pi cotransporter family protein [Maridesulfovibrio hydrothermalis]|uniref:Na+/Picotransporter n=1 Tax=Maridesulfovibrio hydrothermalis AM13 = DSM 14728 TaxID=1121451 RepID=L0R763_9BACT|nr:Na/Pi symporter [Maridesulfovibrio hydrothermalis]CCO22030.1 Na+/Picotransporter [Maridesulfovibrio hydrothermalis AM13 = DSM 14728]
MNFALFGNLLGGLGLFLIGMRLMTTGLKQAAGSSLKKILGQWTRSPGRGLFSGFMITALVQSSSAVTVAVIGFVNAGLITLSQSIGVIYGSNIGTTVTGWIVAAVGFSVNLKTFALPVIALGALLRLSGQTSKRAFFGDAFAGFGLFLLGISTLQMAFKGIESSIDLSSIAAMGALSIPVFIVIGLSLTILMQSSSAAMALVLTATVSGLMDLNQGAAAVIGTNIGTTSTAALSVIGATVNAKKVATGHIIFNIVTALVALILLPVIINSILFLMDAIGLTHEPAVVLALFHTVFNSLGVIILWPFTERLVSFIERRFARKGDDKGRPRYLDSNVIGTPALALDALTLEMRRIGSLNRTIVRKGLSSNFCYAALPSDKEAQDSLIEASRSFCAKLQSRPLNEMQASQIATGLRVLQYFRTAGALSASLEKKRLKPNLEALGADADLVTVFMNSCIGVLNVAENPCSDEFCQIDNMIHDMLSAYHDLKAKLLAAGGTGDIPVPEMVEQLELFSKIRRITRQAAKGAVYLAAMTPESGVCCPTNTIKFAWNRHW